MFCGKYNLRFDEKWRLDIPAAIAKELDGYVLVYENEKDDCIRIKKLPLDKRVKMDPASFYIVEVKEVKNKNNRKRILIPQPLRRSTSFYYGKRVILVGRGDYLEIWPRP